MQAQLHILSGQRAGEIVPLTKRHYVIGRAPDCDWVCDDPSVSRHHCRLTIDELGVRVCDLDSTNGTRVNCNRIGATETLLSNRDLLGFGALFARVVLNAAEQSSSPQKTSGVTTIFFSRDETQIRQVEAPVDDKVAGQT